MSELLDRAIEVRTEPFDDQKPGTSGLRKTVQRFSAVNYIENFVQAIFDTVPALNRGRLVVGGDGRFLNEKAIQTIIRMAAATGVSEVIVGQDGLLSTPAASNLIRMREADAGIILSASHNPGGPQGDFGIKLNIGNGGPAPETLTNAIFERCKVLKRFFTLDTPEVDLSRPGKTDIGGMSVEVVDPVAAYADLMETQFSFDAMRGMAAGGKRLIFDAMNAVTGPYAKEIFERRLGFASGTVINGVPLDDFGGAHPDPNPVHAHELFEMMSVADAPELGAASDGDGDRNLIVGRNCCVSPSDSLAILAANAHLVPAFRDGLRGVARSMPTSLAVDRVAETLRIPVFETPTGWKYFGNLLDAGLVGLCGEESAGTGGAHVREKDGIWAVLFWLNILAATGKSVREILTDHWHRFGRTFYARHDFEGLDAERAQKMMAELSERAGSYSGGTVNRLKVMSSGVFEYEDPTNGELSRNQGVKFVFAGDARIVFRLSGTGTSGATLRIYLERPETNPLHYQMEVSQALVALIEAYRIILDTGHGLVLKDPTVISY